jgi:hypothetical protein
MEVPLERVHLVMMDLRAVELLKETFGIFLLRHQESRSNESGVKGFVGFIGRVDGIKA